MDDRLSVRLSPIDRRNLATLALALRGPAGRRHGATSAAIRHALAAAAKAAMLAGTTTGSLKSP